MKLTITEVRKNIFSAQVDDFAPMEFQYLAAIKKVCLGSSSRQIVECSDGDILAAVCKIAEMSIVSRISETEAEVQ